jgi:hypothetical protein
MQNNSYIATEVLLTDCTCKHPQNKVAQNREKKSENINDHKKIKLGDLQRSMM